MERSVILNISSYRGECFCCRITMIFKNIGNCGFWEQQILPHPVSILETSKKKIWLLKWIILKIYTSLWNKMTVYSCHMLCSTDLPGWPEQGTQRWVRFWFHTGGDWHWWDPQLHVNPPWLLGSPSKCGACCSENDATLFSVKLHCH